MITENLDKVFINITQSNLKNQKLAVFTEQYKKYVKLSQELESMYDFDPFSFKENNKRDKKEILKERRRKRHKINRKRIIVIQEIIKLQMNEIDRFLLVLLEDRNYKIRRLAFRELGQKKNPEVIDYLVDNIKTIENGVNWEIFEILKGYGLEVVRKALDYYIYPTDEYYFDEEPEELLMELILLTKDERAIEPFIWTLMEVEIPNEESLQKIKECIHVYGEKFWKEVERIESEEREETILEVTITQDLRKLLDA